MNRLKNRMGEIAHFFKWKWDMWKHETSYFEPCLKMMLLDTSDNCLRERESGLRIASFKVYFVKLIII